LALKGKSKTFSALQRVAAKAESGDIAELFEVRPGAVGGGNASPYAALRHVPVSAGEL